MKGKTRGLTGNRDMDENKVKYHSRSFEKRVHFKSFISFLKKHYSEKNLKILDLGCGAGELVKVLKEIGYEKSIGMDYDKELVKFAEENQGGSFLIGDINNLPINRESIDVLVINDVLYDPEIGMHNLLGEAERILSPEGILRFDVRNKTFQKIFRMFFINDPYSECKIRMLAKNELKKLLSQFRFETLEIGAFKNHDSFWKRTISKFLCILRIPTHFVVTLRVKPGD